MARILKDEGYLANFKVVDEKGKKTLRLFMIYTPDRRCVITDLKRISRPRIAALRREDGYSNCDWRDGHFDSFHAAGFDDWAGGAQAGRWRRNVVRSLVAKFS